MRRFMGGRSANGRLLFDMATGSGSGRARAVAGPVELSLHPVWRSSQHVHIDGHVNPDQNEIPAGRLSWALRPGLYLLTLHLLRCNW